MHYQQVKIIEAASNDTLESAINCFISKLDRAPLKITFGTFQRYYDDIEDRTPHTRHTAQIIYITNEAEHDRNHHTRKDAR